MNSLRIWIIISWIALPIVMLGGFALLRRLVPGDIWTPFQVTFFRAGLLMLLLYYQYLDHTALSSGAKSTAELLVLRHDMLKLIDGAGPDARPLNQNKAEPVSVIRKGSCDD